MYMIFTGKQRLGACFEGLELAKALRLLREGPQSHSTSLPTRSGATAHRGAAACLLAAHRVLRMACGAERATDGTVVRGQPRRG